MGSGEMKREHAFSGLEAAIVLIAFVVVATVFSYTLLGTGFFATSKAQDTAVTGYKQASAGVYIDGGLYGELNSPPASNLDKLSFYIAIPETGMAEDLSGMIMAYTKADTPSPMTLSLGPNPTSTTFSVGGGGTSTGVLMPGHKTRINFAQLNGPTATDWFSIEIKPKTGAGYLLKRYLPEGYEGGVIR